jgi:hypothetical protein
MSILVGSWKGVPIPSEVWNLIYFLLGGGAAMAVKGIGKESN